MLNLLQLKLYLGGLHCILHTHVNLLHHDILQLGSPNHLGGLIERVLGCECTAPIIGKRFLLRLGLPLKHLNRERLSIQHGEQCKTTVRLS